MLNLLMIDIQNGDENAFAKLYQCTKNSLFAFLYSMCRNKCQAEDIMQNTYIKIRQNCNQFKIGNCYAWIIQIAKNLFYNETKRDSRVIPLDSQQERLDYTIDDCATPLIDKIVSSLPQDESQIILLHILGEFKHREIAEIMQKPLGTITWKYNSAIKKLKTILIKEDWQ